MWHKNATTFEGERKKCFLGGGLISWVNIDDAVVHYWPILSLATVQPYFYHNIVTLHQNVWETTPGRKGEGEEEGRFHFQLKKADNVKVSLTTARLYSSLTMILYIV